MSVGPNKYPQFPFILLDRALDYYSEIANHAHGKGEGGVFDGRKSSFLSKMDHQELSDLVKSLRQLSKPQKIEVNKAMEVLLCQIGRMIEI